MPAHAGLNVIRSWASAMRAFRVDPPRHVHSLQCVSYRLGLARHRAVRLRARRLPRQVGGGQRARPGAARATGHREMTENDQNGAAARRGDPAWLWPVAGSRSFSGLVHP
jgi:hypothetical protein